jgi:chorismate mutase
MTLEEALSALHECRQRIDGVDVRLMELLNERARVVEEIGCIKHGQDLPIYEPKREDQVFANITRNNTGPLSHDAAKRIFERVIDEMRRIQKERMLD